MNWPVLRTKRLGQWDGAIHQPNFWNVKFLKKFQGGSKRRKRFRTGLPRMSLACGLFWAEGNGDPVGSAETSAHPQLTAYKKFKLGALPIIRVSTRDNFLWPIYTWQGKHLITEHLLFLTCCELPSFPSESLGLWPHSLVQDVTYTSFYVFVSEPLVCGASDSHMYIGFPYRGM